MRSNIITLSDVMRFMRALFILVAEVPMQRTIEYRGFEIHVELKQTTKDMFDVWFRVDGPIKPVGVMALGTPIKVRNGPFSRRWAYLVAEISGQATIDVILGAPE